MSPIRGVQSLPCPLQHRLALRWLNSPERAPQHTETDAARRAWSPAFLIRQHASTDDDQDYEGGPTTTFEHLQGLVLRGAQVVCAVLATALLSVTAAQAQPVKVRYDVTTTVGAITDILLYTRYQHPKSGPFNDFWTFSVPAGGGSITDPRRHDLSFDPRAAQLLRVLDAGVGADRCAVS